MNEEMKAKLAKYMNEDGYYQTRRILQDVDGLGAYEAFFINLSPNASKFSPEYQFAIAANEDKMALEPKVNQNPFDRQTIPFVSEDDLRDNS
jgi:hypothetical protein